MRSAVGQKQASANAKLVALRMAAKVVVIVENQNPNALAGPLPKKVRSGKPADAPANDDQVVALSRIFRRAERIRFFSVAQAMDNATENNTRVLAPGEFARADFLHWAWQIKFEAAKNTAQVVDKMLHACGGSGYKRDMELERYLRDAKAGWVMGPTNEVLRQFVGKAVLLGFEALDYWNQTYNRRAVENELKKLDAKGKRELGEQLLAEAEEQAAKEPAAAT